MVDELSANGVTFERYDETQLQTDTRGIHSLDDGKVAWFKDPDGNTFAILGSSTTSNEPAVKATTPRYARWATAGWRSFGTACARVSATTSHPRRQPATGPSDDNPPPREVERAALGYHWISYICCCIVKPWL